jgi:hypothetical protein
VSPSSSSNQAAAAAGISCVRHRTPPVLRPHPPGKTKGHYLLLSSNRHGCPIHSSSKRNRRDLWSTNRRPLKTPPPDPLKRRRPGHRASSTATFSAALCRSPHSSHRVIRAAPPPCSHPLRQLVPAAPSPEVAHGEDRRTSLFLSPQLPVSPRGLNPPGACAPVSSPPWPCPRSTME